MRTSVKLSAAVAAAATLGLGACSAPSDAGSGAGSSGGTDAPLTVAATPTPHGDILNYVRDNLAKDAGLELEVREFDDYVLPNTATQSGEVDANFFQHKPYLDDFNEQKGTDIVPVVNVELEPLGLYSEKLDAVSGLEPGSTVALPDDATNEGRALKLLADNGAIELKDGVGSEATLADIEDDKGLRFKELEAAQIPTRLADVDAAVVNGNYAIGADLKPAKDAIVLEKAENNPYANFLAVKKGNEDDPRVKKLAKLLNSDPVEKFIQDRFEGSILPAFGPVGS
ncbi:MULTISPECIES: MetQ/NlpA family ABC transporter substrate-binding protein [Streptomyces]|uniref:Lipoprotein n=1 Tax=Streptomyces lycii TaxID=2654337 RepID=A0ABQ7FDW1_9ACTN|nr:MULTISPECIES: MetQ/NlpA family ABC transporter substrate-binding protein [Streptomyces]KAF4406168.1 ABC transporter substrate-binding protein [Streptomyces lycii]PGH51331.1 metal ABC transporter substrate-binding protein [Streptomyces sp. Ru87]